MNDAQVHATILDKIQEFALAAGISGSQTRLGADDNIPESGVLDSASLLELIMWYESEFDVQVAPEEMTIENLGTVRRMAEFLRGRGC